MIEYRRMRPSDVDAVTALGVEALRKFSSDIPLHVSPPKVRAVVNTFCVRHEHFHEIAFKDGEPVGAVAMFVAEMPFHERSEGHVMMCYAKEPGTGVRLIADMMRWARMDMRISRVQWCMNNGAGRYAAMLKRRWNFSHHVDNLIYHKGSMP